MPESKVPLDRYKLIVVPALYAASDAEISRLNDDAKAGGHLLHAFKRGFSDENTVAAPCRGMKKIRRDPFPPKTIRVR